MDRPRSNCKEKKKKCHRHWEKPNREKQTINETSHNPSPRKWSRGSGWKRKGGLSFVTVRTSIQEGLLHSSLFFYFSLQN